MSGASAGAQGLVCFGEARRWQEGMLTLTDGITSGLFRVADVHICLLRCIDGLPEGVFHRRHCEQVACGCLRGAAVAG